PEGSRLLIDRVTPNTSCKPDVLHLNEDSSAVNPRTIDVLNNHIMDDGSGSSERERRRQAPITVCGVAEFDEPQVVKVGAIFIPLHVQHEDRKTTNRESRYGATALNMQGVFNPVFGD